jgi:hypothetical protein
MVNYQDAKIYKIECNETNKIYIGSTCLPTLSKRLAHHVADYKRYKEGKTKKYMSSFEVLKNNNYDIYLLENYPCNNRDELRAKEGEYIKQFECINKNIAGRTKEQFYKDVIQPKQEVRKKNIADKKERREKLKEEIEKIVQKIANIIDADENLKGCFFKNIN